MAQGWISYGPEFWDVGLQHNPPTAFRALHPFSSNGGRPVWHQYQGVAGKTVIKKASAERVRELLGVLNFTASPFGSQEYQLLNFGVEGVDFNFDARGNPVKTPKGMADTSVPWPFLAQSLPVLFDPNDANFVKVAYADEQALSQYWVADPSAQLYSLTDSNKGLQLAQSLADGLGQIVRGSNPVSALDQLLNNWRSGGGDQIRSEYQQAYASSH
jgi:putative aldouronate transport system substrate-binding protein